MTKKRGMQMKNRRGQAALEFLMTYGWAILVVLIVIGALAYFGILNPSILLPEKCTLQMGLYCNDHRIDGQAGTITFNFQNGMGKDIIIRSINVSGEVIPGGCYAGVSNGSIVFDGDASTIIPNSCDGTICMGCPLTEAYYGCNNIIFANKPFASAFNSNVGARIAQGSATTITTNCTLAPLSWSGKAKVALDIQWFYADSSVDYVHTMEGELLAKVEGQ